MKRASAKPAQPNTSSAAPGELTEAQIRGLMIDKLRGSALDEEDADLLRLELLTRGAARKRGLPMFEGFIIPYFHLDGTLDKFYRVRYLVDTRKGFDKVAGKKPLRYIQPKDSDSGVYLPPFVDWAAVAQDVDSAIVITEGELKAACATKHGVLTMGLGGVWSFQSKKHNQPLLPVLQDGFQWKGRQVFICYDSDAATNPNVVAAEQRLAQRLVELGAQVFITRLPAHEELQKCGLDDFIALHGADAFAELLDSDKTYQFEQAKVLHQLSERVVYVRNPGLIWDHHLRARMSPGDFVSHAFANWHYWQSRVNKAGIETREKVSAARAWIQWEARAECLGLTFAPGESRITPDGNLNTWTGWGVSEPAEGDVEPWHHLLTHLFGGDERSRRWFEQWCAYPLQHPGTKMATAAAIWGPVHGSGKTLVGHTLMRIYGAHAAELKDTDLEDDRNEWAEGKCFALCDDITAKGDRKFMRRLMTMVTQKMIRLNPKYVPSYSVPDRLNYYYTSNDPDALYMDENDRRFFIHETHAGKYTDYKRYVKWRESDAGIAALWYYLLQLDVSDFDPQAPAPESTGKRSMIEVGKSELGSWVLEFRRNTDYMLAQAGLTGDLFSMKQLHGIYDPMGNKRATVNALAREFKREGYNPACDGAPVRLLAKDSAAPSLQCVVWPVRNAERWLRATWTEVRDEYAKHQRSPASKKF